jgi:hypothetical protein
MTTVRFRPATSGERGFVFTVRKAAHKKNLELMKAWDEEEELRTHERRFASQGYRIVVCDEPASLQPAGRNRPQVEKLRRLDPAVACVDADGPVVPGGSVVVGDRTARIAQDQSRS